MKYKVGDKVITTKESDGNLRLFPVGTEGIIVEITREGKELYKVKSFSKCWWYDEDMLKPCKTYSQGLAEAWELAQRVMKKRDWNDIDGYFKYFGIRTYCELFEKYSYEEAFAKLEAYEKAKEIEKTHIEEVAKMLGVELYEEFRIQPTEYAIVLGHKENDYIFRFDSELVHKSHNDGYSEWYGGCEKILNYLILGLYVIVKGGAE